ncbi:aryl-alcohol oxidase, partial [Cyathus striatus]
RVPETSLIFQNVSDPAAGPHTPHFEFVLVSRSPQTLPTGELSLGLEIGMVTPASCGSVSLESNDPFDTPLIDPAYYKDEVDLLIMKEAIASAERFFAGLVWKDIILGPQGAFANITDDQSLVQFIRESSYTTLHSIGTASMFPRGTKFGVVDPDLHLRGAKGLRIIDASIMPIVTCGHTQASTYAIVERAAELVKQAWT